MTPIRRTRTHRYRRTRRTADVHQHAAGHANGDIDGVGVAKVPEGNAAQRRPVDAEGEPLAMPVGHRAPGRVRATCASSSTPANVKSDYDADGIADVTDLASAPTSVERMPNTAETAAPSTPNTELGLGAYEFSVEYDNFVIQSVNPCDIVFGPGGAGATRGPVDELNSSSRRTRTARRIRASANNGTCSMSLVLENVIRFGCVTNGRRRTDRAATSIWRR